MTEKRTPLDIMIDRACGLEEHPSPVSPVVVPDAVPTALLAVVDAAMAWWHSGGGNSPGAENEALARAVEVLHALGWEV